MNTVQKEPIAIIGMGCRFPGAENPQAFWDLLCAGKEAIQEIPENRWDLWQLYDRDPSQPGKIMSRWAGLLEQIDQFDWRAFHLLPKEVKHMDPQQRLLHEVTWEALEDAGIPFKQLTGSNTGVFIGIGWSDYLRLLSRNWALLDGYVPMGNANCFAANRLSYLFDLQGPSMALDAGCSSSLAALYAGCQSLWTGETNIAIVGGVNILLSPDATIMLSKAELLSPDGHCKALDAQADGFVRAEGGAVIILKPISHIQETDRVYALIRNVQIQHNGHNEWIISSSQRALERLLRSTYSQIGLSSQDIDYIELHGTGFLRGDAIEVGAIAAVITEQGKWRKHPCYIGSVKTNIGHLEAASGMAGLIKSILAIYNRAIPPTINVREVNPALPLTEHNLMANDRLRAWPERQQPARAGITTLGFAGAIAHAVVEEFIPRKEPSSEQRTEQQLQLLPLSARTKEALQANVTAFIAFCRQKTTATDWHDICYTAAVRRTHHEYRLALLAQSQQEAASLLDRFIHGQTHPRISSGKVLEPSQRKLTFLFAHKISTNVVNKIVSFYQQEQTFQRHVKKYDRLFYDYAHTSPLEELLIKSSNSNKIDNISIPLLFIIQTALAATWSSWGIIPQTIIGEGNGKMAAAFCAGLLTIEQVLASICSLPDISENPETLQQAGLLENLPTANNPITFYALDNGLAEEQQLALCGQQEHIVLDIPPHIMERMTANGNNTLLEIGPPTGLSAAFLAKLEHQKFNGTAFASLCYDEDVFTTYLQIARYLYTLGYPVHWSATYPEKEHHLVSLPTYQWQRERLWPDWLDVAIISTPPQNIRPLPAASNQKQDSNAKTPSLLTKLEQAEPWKRRQLIQSHLMKRVCALLELDEHQTIKMDQKLFALGMDSITAAQLRHYLQLALERTLPVTLLFNYPTIDSLTNYLLQELYPLIDEENSSIAFSLSHQNYKQQEDNIEALSDEETEKLLLKIIEALEEI